jgi:hypothetical protein
MTFLAADQTTCHQGKMLTRVNNSKVALPSIVLT